MRGVLVLGLVLIGCCPAALAQPGWSLESASTPTSIPGRLAFDEARAETVFVNSSGETWAWDGRSWTQRATTGPPHRSYPELTFDPNSNTVVLFGGELTPNNWISDTWTWDGSSWTQQQRTEITPRRGSLVFDTATQKVTLLGADSPEVWTWSPACSSADLFADGVLDYFDLLEFIRLWLARDTSADIDRDGIVTPRDIRAFINAFLAGCP